MQRACALGEAALDLADDGGDLRYVVDLPVQHRARLVLHALGGEDMEHPVPLFGDDADDAARSDIEREDQFCRTFAAHRPLCGRALILFGAAAPLGGGHNAMLMA